MTLRELHPIYREALCVWEAFRRAGFGAEEIYVGKHPPEGSFVVALPRLRYGWLVKPPGCDPLALAEVPTDELVGDWQEAARLWNELALKKDPELAVAWQESDVGRRTVEFVAAMLSNGVELPCSADC